MTTLTTDIKEIFFNIFRGDTSVEDFEKWIYQTKELEKQLTGDIYYDLISFDYKQPKAKYELVKIIEQLIDLGEFETWKLRQLLRQTRERIGNYPKAITQFYDLYCKGYYFMDNLAFGYGLPLDCPWSKFGIDSFDKLTMEQQKQYADSFFPDIEGELKKVSDWLDSKKIILTGKRDNELGRYEFEDSRSEEEKQPTTYTRQTIIDNKNKK